MTYYRRQRLESFKRAVFSRRLNGPVRELAIDIAEEAERERELPSPAPRGHESSRSH